MKTRTITKNGQAVAVTVHSNDGLRKRCGCARRSWATCAHPWFFSFKLKGGQAHRFVLDKYSDQRIVTKADALKERDRLRTLIRDGQFPPVRATAAPAPLTPSDLTFADFADKWRTRARAAVSASQKVNDQAQCKVLGALVLDGQPLAERALAMITSDDIEAAFAQLQGRAHSTLNKYVVCLRQLEHWGLRNGYLTRPWLVADETTILRQEETTAKRDRRLVPDKVDDKGKIVEPGEERRLLQHASPWLQRLIVASLETGCRRGELLSLTWADISADRTLLTIRAEKAKSGKSRRIPVSPRLLAILSMIDQDPAGQPHKATAFVFGNSIGGQIADPKKSWARALQAAEITDLHFHDLRHEAGSRLLEAGWPLHEVQRMLGHANVSTTSTYLNSTDVHLLDSMKRYGTSRSLLHPVAQTEISELPPGGNDQEPAVAKSLVN